MAGVVNEPDLDRLQEYRDAAASVNTSVTPDSEPFGGVFAVNPDAAATSATASGSAPASTSTSAAGGGWGHLSGHAWWLSLGAVGMVLAV